MQLNEFEYHFVVGRHAHEVNGCSKFSAAAVIAVAAAAAAAAVVVVVVVIRPVVPPVVLAVHSSVSRLAVCERLAAWCC